mgnify:CR=1 FL=1
MRKKINKIKYSTKKLIALIVETLAMDELPPDEDSPWFNELLDDSRVIKAWQLAFPHDDKDCDEENCEGINHDIQGYDEEWREMLSVLFKNLTKR